jgi:hypothetical protein
LYRRKSILTKRLSSLQIAVITIKTETTTETTEITTETTEITTETTETTKTLVTIEYTDNLITTADSEDVVISVRKRIANYRNIQR